MGRSSGGSACALSQRQAPLKKQAPSKKQEPDDGDGDGDDDDDGEPVVGEEVYLQCARANCDYEEVCEPRNGRLTFSEYYCPRCGCFLVVLTRQRVR